MTCGVPRRDRPESVHREAADEVRLLEIAEAARRHGFNLTDLVGRGGNRQKKADRTARYANPANRDETWSGLGRRPQWVKAALDAGQSLDDLTV